MTEMNKTLIIIITNNGVSKSFFVTFINDGI